jgi:hypothetical protein
MPDSAIPAFVIAERLQRRRKRRWLLAAVAMLILLPILAFFALSYYGQYVSELDLQEAIAETDRLDPGWRLEDIEKRRATLPPEQNAALPIKAAAALVVVVWSPKDIDPKYPERQVDPKRAAALRELLKPMLPAAVLARKALRLKTGYYPVQLDLNGPYDNHDMHVRNLGHFLAHVALLENEDGNHEDGWQRSLNILAAALSYGEDPTIFSLTVRASLRTLTAQSLERCLAQGKVSDPLLAQAQQSLAEEAIQPIFQSAFRGERAGVHKRMTELETGQLNLDQLFGGSGSPSSEIRLKMQLTGSTFEREHAWMLRHFNEVVQCTTLPPVEMLAKMRELDKKRQANAGPLAVRMTFGTSAGFAETELKSYLQLVCAIAGIGVERYRLQHGHWPDSLDDVVTAKLLENVPVDVYDGKPLTLRKTAEGVVVSGMAPDGKPCEFRLWNENDRRQPASAEAKLAAKQEKS